MKSYFKISAVVLALCAAYVLPSPAVAQVDFGFGDGDKGGGQYGPSKERKKILNPYDKKYRPDPEKTDEEEKESSLNSLFPNFIYYFGLIRQPDADPDELSLLVTSPGQITGCVNVEKPVIETKVMGKVLKLSFTDGAIEPDDEIVRYYHYNCSPTVATSSTVITLNKTFLLSNGIEKLVMESDSIGRFSDVMIDFKRYSTTITAKMMDMGMFGMPKNFKMNNTQTFWDYPENTIVLTPSGAGADLRDEATMEIVKEFARSRNMTPMDEIIPDYLPHRYHQGKLYVVDNSRRFVDQLETPDDYVEIGKFSLPATRYSANGAYDVADEKIVFARLLGTLD